MDVIGKWTGHAASQLQDALRMTNQAFAARIGAAERTVAGWHSKPDVIPRPDMQAALDTLYERADTQVRLRFKDQLGLSPGPAQAQALRVAIAVVVRHGKVLLVCRRDGGAISWQFPAGIVKPGGAPEAVTVSETFAETGVHCSVRSILGTRLHPVTGALCEYRLCDYLAGEAVNLDPLENAAVQWAPLADLPKFIPTDRIFPPILEALA